MAIGDHTIEINVNGDTFETRRSAAVTSELVRLSHLPPCQLVDYPADLVARLRRMREAHGYLRVRMLVHIERCERARGLEVCASVSIPPEGDVWGASVTAVACYSGHELLALRIPGSDVWQLPTAYQVQAWADGRITIGAQLWEAEAEIIQDWQ